MAQRERTIAIRSPPGLAAGLPASPTAWEAGSMGISSEGILLLPAY
jgi:hypothetical protein